MPKLDEAAVRIIVAAHHQFVLDHPEATELEKVLAAVEAATPGIIEAAVGSRKVEALLIPTDISLAPRLVTIEPTLTAIQAVIGGGPNSSPWNMNGHAVTAQLKDIGKDFDEPANVRASFLGHLTGSITMGDTFTGDVLLTGRRSGILDATDLPGYELNWATNAIDGETWS